MQFQPAHIPAGVNTYEKLLLWAAATLHFATQGLEFKEREPNAAVGDSGIQKVVEANGPFISADGTPRKLYRLSLPLEADYEGEGYVMTWQASKEITTATAAANFIA
jgi:hypothetical protein